MGNLSSSRFTPRSNFSSVELAALRQVDTAVELLRSYLEEELLFEQLQLSWTQLNSELLAIGYELRLVQPSGEKLCVHIRKLERRPTKNLRFCFCGAEAQTVFCNKLWCQKCLTHFLKEAF